MKPIKMALPRTLDGALASLGESFDDARLLAGGTDLVSELKERTAKTDTVVNLKRIPGLDQFQQTERGLEIGALVTLQQIIDNADVQKGYPALAHALTEAANPNLRNVGTLGGNLCQKMRCWYYRDDTYPCLRKGGSTCYAQDGENEYHSIYENEYCCAIHPSSAAPVLIAHGAVALIAGPNGKREVAMDEFFVPADVNPYIETVVEPNEVLTGVLLPKGSESTTCAYVETRDRQAFDWAVCGATVNVIVRDGKKINTCRVVLSAVAPTPLRRKDLEEMLAGKEVTEKVLDEVAEAAAKTAKPLEQNGYKVHLTKVVLKRAIRQAMKG